MLNIKPGEHGSTFGGNPLACQVATAALQVLKDENLFENSLKTGEIFRQALKEIKYPWIKDVRGRGLMNAMELNSDAPVSAWELCLKMRDLGLLAKPTHDTTIRFSPPLVITEKQIHAGAAIVAEACRGFNG
jgi:ornithine--oxo-acid transaminase